MNDVRVFKDLEAVAHAAADYINQQITSCMNRKEHCHVVLPGGTTPALIFQLLAEKPLPWKKVHWYVGDERCYPVGHRERNDTMIKNQLFSAQNSSLANFHPIPAELGPELAAQNYAEVVDEVIDNNGGLDIVLLGMGEDGHTASLFPGNKALDDVRTVVPVFNAPKPPEERVSFGLSTLKNSHIRIVIATGESKREILQKAIPGNNLPVSQVQAGVWFIDEAANTLI